jgi:enoyl-CoA hydratase/carnithine racemase
MDYETIKFELQENGIGIITLNRPDQLNAMSFQMMEDLNHVLDSLMVNLDCRVVILRAEGRIFCAGMDLKEAPLSQKRRLPEELTKYYYLNVPEVIKRKLYAQDRVSQIILKLRKINQPIIAIIQGAASGAGFAFAMAADVRIASEGTKFNNAFINIGFSGSDMGSSYFLPRLIGLSRASELLYTGRFFEANEAEKIGFISRVVKIEELLDSALELAEEMLSKSPLGLRMTKEAINLSLDAPSLATMVDIENHHQMLCSVSKDVMEGVQAFLEKRKPNFTLK